MDEYDIDYEGRIGHPFNVGVMHLDVRLPGCRSLKEKRGRLARLLNPIRKKHMAIICEVGDHDLWDRAGLAAVSLSTDRAVVRNVLERITAEIIASGGEAELIDQELEWR